MHVKTMEGLVGASTNMNLLDTPMRVFKEARRRGDTATMERAMGYAGEFAGKAEEYRAEADGGMKEEAKEVRDKEKAKSQEAAKKRREECESQEENIAESKAADDKAGSDKIKTDEVKEPVTYTKTGEVVRMEQREVISLSV